jgi:hypothetical protein
MTLNPEPKTINRSAFVQAMALYNEAKDLYTKAWGGEGEEEGREGRLEDTHVVVANKCLVCFSDWHPKRQIRRRITQPVANV